MVLACISRSARPRARVGFYAIRASQKTREMGLGSLQAISLAEARDTARQYRKLLTEGKDPIEVRDAQKTEARLKSSKTISFAECAKNYIAAHRSGWRNPKRIAQWERHRGEQHRTSHRQPSSVGYGHRPRAESLSPSGLPALSGDLPRRGASVAREVVVAS